MLSAHQGRKSSPDGKLPLLQLMGSNVPVNGVDCFGYASARNGQSSGMSALPDFLVHLSRVASL